MGLKAFGQHTSDALRIRYRARNTATDHVGAVGLLHRKCVRRVSYLTAMQAARLCKGGMGLFGTFRNDPRLTKRWSDGAKSWFE